MYLLVRGLSEFSGICQTDITREYHVKLLLFVLSTGTILKFNALPTNPILIAKFSFRWMFRSNIRFFPFEYFKGIDRLRRIDYDVDSLLCFVFNN